MARGAEPGVDSRLPPLNNKTAKVHRLVRLLQEHSEGLGISQMASSLSVDERTVKRYLTDLRRLKFELVQKRSGSGRRTLYHIRGEGTPPGHFLSGLRKIRAELHAGGNPKHSALISQLIRFLEEKDKAPAGGSPGEAETPALPPSGDLYYIDHGPFAEAEPSPGILKILETAIASRTAVRLSYSGYGAGGEFLYYPYVLSLRVGTLYLIGRQGDNRGPFKSLSVKRIKRCIASRETFVREAFDPAEYYKYCFGQWPRQLHEEPETVLLAIRAAWLEKYLSESHFHPEGQIVRNGKDLCFELKVVIKPDFVNWVMSLVPELFPVKPATLVESVRERLRKGLEAAEAGE